MPVTAEVETPMEIDPVPIVKNHTEEKGKRNGFEDSAVCKVGIWNGDHFIFNSCKNLAHLKCKEDGTNHMKRFLECTNQTKALVKRTEELREKLSNFMESKSFLFTTPINSLKSHALFKTFSANIATAVNGSSRNSQEPQSAADGLEVVSVVSRAKADLPPTGELKRPDLIPGTKVWVMKTNCLEEFVEGVIMQVRDANPEKLFKVRFEDTKGVAPKLYNAKQLAYRSSPEVILPVGSRIIARYSDGIVPKLYAGIVAEPPKITNLERYLIFFDDGYAQYLEHRDLYLVCSQSVDVADDVHNNISEFIRGYLLKYPERPMVKLQKNQITKTEYSRKWWDTKVLEVDASMVKMYFLASQRTEWIYRGSTRLKLLYNELKSAAEHRQAGKHRRHNIVPRKPHQPYVEYTREEEIVTIDSDSEEENKEVRSYPRRKTGGSQYLLGPEKRIRNTARKSTSQKSNQSIVQRAGMYHKPDTKSHAGYRDVHNLMEFERTKYRHHKCSYFCREEKDPAIYKGKNPFLIPLYSGWERQLWSYRRNGAKVTVMYRAPCGRHLRDLQEIFEYLVLISSRLTIDYFSLDLNLLVFRTFRPKEIFYEDKDVTQGKENVPVGCVNSWADEKPPYVEYAAKRFPGQGVYLNEEEEFLCGCSCTDNCIDPSKCECQRITAYCNGARHESPFYRFRRLSDTVITGIYECNSTCKCATQCVNRVVQNGLQVRLQMFKTLNKGWGIRCLDDIDAGMFICIYAGQLLTETGADRDGNEFGDEYLAELDHIEVVERSKEGYEEDCDMEDYELENSIPEPIKEEEDSRSPELSPNSTDSEANGCDTDSDFESSLRNTSTTTYTTRSRKRKHAKSTDSSSGLSLSSLNIADDSNSNHDNEKRSTKELPDISSDYDTYAIIPRPLSPASAAFVENTELKRIPKLSENGLDMKTVAKKSFGMKNPISSLESSNIKQVGFRSIRSYYGEDSLYVMDAKSKGNIGRYLNHSCAPNVFVQNVFVHTHDLRFPEVAFFAQHYIPAGTELTWNYNYEVGGVTDKVMYCYCDKRCCRGRLL